MPRGIEGMCDEPKVYECIGDEEGNLVKLFVTCTEEGVIMDVWDEGEENSFQLATSSETAEEIVERLMTQHGPVDLYWRKHGIWSEYPEYPREDWKLEVVNGDTNLGYWEWVEHQEEQ